MLQDKEPLNWNDKSVFIRDGVLSQPRARRRGREVFRLKVWCVAR